MILYYTASQKTKVFADALSAVLGSPVYQLKSKLETPRAGFMFLLRSLLLAAMGKPYPVDNMPEVNAKEIYLCAPIWGGRAAAPVLYFLAHADLRGRKVHLLLTCGSIQGQEGYKKKAREALDRADCVPGEVYIFATGGGRPEKDVIEAQLRDMLPVA